MKVVLLAGGFGTRISEESHLRPKPMIEIGGKPVLWHIMKEFSYYGFYEFIICAGYKQQVIKEWFANYYLHNSDVTFDFADRDNRVIHSNVSEPWQVTVVDTGLETMTGRRVKRIQPYVGEEPFFLTYGDGVADIDLAALASFHKSHGKIATVSVCSVAQRFGVLEVDENKRVTSFREKSQGDGPLINIGYMVFGPEVFDYIDGDGIVLEKEPLERLCADGQLMAYEHPGFWKCMDTQREKENLEEMIQCKKAPWMVWSKST